MDPVTLIVTALAAGAAMGMTELAASAVKDAYRTQISGKSASELR